MGERMRRSLRRAVTVLAVLVGSALVVLLAAGDRLLGDRVFTDGSALVDRAIWEGAARFAWKDTGPLPEPLGGPDGEASPAFGSGHPDLYFCRKTEDHWDLWRSPWTPDGHGRPEPLFELNTGRNERDPVLFRGGRLLVFSSDRPGGRGGYDLWAAEVTADGFQEPRNLGTKLNSTADDRAPTSDTFGRRMVFASNRLAVDRVSFDLFESESVGGRWSEPALIHALQTEDDGESRAPALSPDGRFLVFASDREGGAGGYDLYRTVRYDGQWRKPVSMTELNTEADETDAAFSPEGTAIVFARTRLDGDGFTMNLHQAERRELISLNDGQSDLWSKLLILLAGILLALLLSYLTLFWHGIHPFIKFVIMSLLVHLLVLLYMQGQRLPAPEFGGSGEQSFVVSFIPSADDGESEAGGEAAQGDKVAPTQRGFAQPSARQTERPAPTSPASAPSQSMVAARAATESTREATRDAQAPSRATTDAASRALAEANTADAQDAQERKAGSDAAPATAVAGAATTAASRASVNPSSERAASAAPATATANPGAMGADRAMSTGRTGRPNVAQATPGGAGPVSRATGAPAPRAFAKNAREAGQRKSASDAPGASIVADASATPANRLESGTGQPAPTATPRRPVAAGEGVAAPAPGALVARRDAGVSAPSPASASRGALARAARPSPRIGGRAADGGARSSRRTGRDAAPSVSTSVRAFDGGGRVDSLAGVRRPGSARASTAMTTGAEPRPASSLSPRRAGPRAPSASAPSVAPASARSRAPTRSRRSGGSAAEAARDTMGPELPAEAADLAREASSVGARRIDPTAMVRRGRRPAPAAGATSAAPPAARMLVQARRAQVGVPESPRPAMAHAQRRGTAKRRALQRGGGSAETEAAVLAGLRYLKSIQRRNGSWGRNHRHNKYGDFRVGKTALCLLAFLGSGHTHQENGEFQETVRRGLDWLISQQDRPTGHFGDSSAYGHGISTYAFAEAYAMTRDPRLRGPLRRAVGRVVTAQMTSRERKLDGGWPYYYRDPDRRHDRFPRMSVSVWQVMALKSARIGGINVPETSLQRAKRFVLAAHDPRLHAFRYNHDPEWLSTSYPTLPGTTPAALFALQLLGGDRTGEEYQTGLRYIGRRPLMTRWRRYSDEEFATRGLSNLYYYYYATLALFFEGGDAWKQWNSRLTRLLVGGQDRDGSWRPVSYYAEYARDTDRDRVYTTAMSVLMLEVYYRYFTPLLTSMEKSK